jgi:hypothetical protein
MKKKEVKYLIQDLYNKIEESNNISQNEKKEYYDIIKKLNTKISSNRIEDFISDSLPILLKLAFEAYKNSDFW